MAIVDSLPSTDQITDPQVRHFCDALLNAWQLRNGVSGDGSQRFITADEWNQLINNPVISTLTGLPGMTPILPGPGGGPGEPGVPGVPGPGAVPPLIPINLPPAAQALITLINSPIATFDFVHLRQNINEIWTAIKATEQLVNQAAGEGSTIIDDAIANAALQHQIDQINFIDPSSESHSAQQVSGVRLSVYDPTKGLAAAHASIIEINTVEATSTSASAQHLYGLQAKVDDPNTGLAKAVADIVQVNTVSATSTSANARTLATMTASTSGNSAAIVAINNVSTNSTSANASQLAGMTAKVNNPATGLDAASAAIVQINTISAQSGSASARKVAGLDATVTGPNGIDAHTAQIGEINNVVATSTSASARRLASVQALSGFKGRTFIQTAAPVSTFSPPLPAGQEYALAINDLWINSGTGNTLNRWTGSAWVETSDNRISQSGAGITTEANARSEADLAEASAINTIWGFVGSDTAIISTDGSIRVTPGVSIAQKWNQLQSDVYTANADGSKGPTYSAKLRQDYQTYTSMNEGRAQASYVMRVNTEANGVKSVAGMGLYSEVNPAGPTSAMVFQADGFYIFNDGDGSLTPAQSKVVPFAVVNGIVRQNISYITDYIRSDSYSAGVSGWIIRSNGNAEFNGAVFAGKVASGSVLFDRTSGQNIAATALGTLSGSFSGTGVQTSANLIFYGPNQHSSTSSPYNRIRNTNNGVALMVLVNITGVVDHFLTLWLKGTSRPNFVPVAGVIEPQNGPGSIALAWSSLFGVADGDWHQFGFSCTDSNGNPLPGGSTNMNFMNCTVQISNL